MFTRILAVARTTFTEAVRQPIYAVVIFMTWLMLILNLNLSAFSLEDDNKLLLDLGMSSLLISGLLLSAFCASGAVSAEIEDRTVLTIVSKPVSRTAFLLGKFLGLNAALFMAFYLCSLAFLFTVRHRVMQSTADQFDLPVIIFSFSAVLLALLIAALGNYLYRWHFSSVFLRLAVPLLTVAMILIGFITKYWEFQWPFGADFAIRNGPGLTPILMGLGLIYIAVLMISGVALAASTRMGQVMTLILCSAFFLLGLISNYLFGRFADHSMLADFFYRATGNLQPFWVTDAITQAQEITWKYAGMSAAYGLLYTAGLLALAVSLFQTREVG